MRRGAVHGIDDGSEWLFCVVYVAQGTLSPFGGFQIMMEQNSAAVHHSERLIAGLHH